MTKLHIFTAAIAAAVLCVSNLSAQNPEVGVGIPLDAVPIVEIPELDWAALFAEDSTRNLLDEPPRFAIPHKVSITSATHGIWEQLDFQTMRWSLRVASPNAISMNLGFESWAMPRSGSMTISATDGSMVIRPFTANDNKDHGQLWTPVIMGDEVLVEIVVSKMEQGDVQLLVELTSINVGYRGFYEHGLDRSGACNVDVVCEEGDLWWDEIPCVAVISNGGSTFCTGFMVNNTSQDRTPYFMSANHCNVNAPSLVTYWNYQNSYCRVPGSGDSGGSGDGYLNQFNTGATHLSSGGASDYTLVVLDDSPDDAWEVSFCGWDATGDDADQAIAIHHPQTDEKRISFEYQPTTTTSYLGESIPGDGTHVRVEDWDLGTTEPGSSGSPVFNQDHKVIGQLHGGYASCSSQTSDWYGKFSVSFVAGLEPHLDSAGTGQLTLATLPGTGMTVSPGENVLHLCTFPCTDPDPAEVVYTIVNNSPDILTYTVENLQYSDFILVDGGVSTKGYLLSGSSVDVVVSVVGDLMDYGVHQEVVRFTDKTNDRFIDRTHTLDVGTTEFTLDPESDFVAGGPVGGPFPTTQLYTITSTRPTPFDVVVFTTEYWITLNGSTDPVTVSLDGLGDTATVIVGFGGTAGDLPAGIVEGDVYFDNVDGDGGDTSRHITLDVGRYTYVATDLPQPITDYNTTTSYIVVGDAYCVGDVDIELDLTHTFVGDLIVEVTSPQGTTVRLHDRSGGSSDDIHAYYDDNGADDPDGPGELADFIGEIVTGTWTMIVSDNAGADQGSFDHWALKIASSGDECPPVAYDLDILTDEYTPVDIMLEGASTGNGPLDYIITSLSTDGDLSDMDGTPIGSLPFLLQGDTVHYEPDFGFVGVDLFTYRVDDGAPSLEANVIVHVGEVPYPDECSVATEVLNGSWEFSTLEATDSSDSYNDSQCDSTVLGVMNQDVWFSYLACADGSLTVSTCDLIDFDSDLVVYEGTCSSMTQIACNGDTSGCAGYSSTLITQVYEGSSYLIRVGGWSGSSAGSGVLLVDGPEGDCGGTPCPADINGDGTVGVNDVLAVIDQWGVAGGPSDVNGDGIVDVVDLLAVVGTWGPCP